MKYLKFGYGKIKETLFYHLMRLQRRKRNQVKVFCIGRNKTGTTSIASFFRQNGYKVGNQETAEMLMEDWNRRKFNRIIEYCETAEVFQDVPFSLPYTFEALDVAFPNSKFILTIRSTPEIWYNSLVSYHAKITSSSSTPPSEDDLRQFRYRGKHKGWLLFMQKVVYGYPDIPLYDKQSYITHYENYNASVINYFQNRPNDLLVINLSEKNAFEKLCLYVGIDPTQAKSIPHLNRGKNS